MGKQNTVETIIRELDREVSSLAPETIARLHLSRENALLKHHAPQHASVLASSNCLTLGRPHPRSINRWWLPSAVLILMGLLTLADWQAPEQDDDLGGVDSALLSDDLPVHAFVDYRLSEWIESSKP